MKTYKGSCHCGAVTYEVEAEFTNAIRCNCSYCSRKGALLAFVPKEQFTLTSGEDSLTEYHFNTEKIDHLFCKVCGVESFSYGADPEGNKMAAINLNCIEGFEMPSDSIMDYDGKNM